MKHFDNNAEERILKIYGADISVFSDGSVWIKRGSRNKRRFGDISPKGYMRILVRDNGKERTVFVHRLVAMAYVDNPLGKPQVNHINGDKTDNRPDNLEWCTNYENSHHRATVLKKFSKTTPVVCVETGIRYETVSDAARKTKTNRGNIQRCLNDGRQAGGFHWKRDEVI